MKGYRLVLLVGMLLLVVLACGVVQVISIAFGWALDPYSVWSIHFGGWDIVKLEEDLEQTVEHNAYRERLMRMERGWDSRSGKDESDDDNPFPNFGPFGLTRPLWFP